MGNVKGFSPEKLVFGILISSIELKERLFSELKDLFGPIDFISSELDFTYTQYYNAEMGRPITRIFCSFQELVNPEHLPGIKIKTNRLEDHFRIQGKRKVNLDPGLLSLGRFILATTKDSSHRIPIGSGIYAEVTLMYEGKSYRPIEWTYPDYSSPEYLEILKKIRTLYKNQIKNCQKTD